MKIEKGGRLKSLSPIFYLNVIVKERTPLALNGESFLSIFRILKFNFGGDEGDRTPDLLTASQTLSQLSYAPKTGLS